MPATRLTRQHFQAIATALAETRPRDVQSACMAQWRATRDAIRGAIRQFNGMFDRDRFDRWTEADPDVARRAEISGARDVTPGAGHVGGRPPAGRRQY